MSENDKEKFSSSNIVESFDYALKGLIYAIRTQRNMRIHMIIAILVIISSLFLNLTRIEMIMLIFAIALVLITELLNTASELIIDLITEKHHPLAKIIKDMTAGAVLFASICAAIAGYLIFMRKEVLDVLGQSIVIEKISVFPPYITAITIFLVLVVTLFIKGLKGRYISLEGGMPSIHTAVAFSLAVLTYVLSMNIYVFLASLLLACMVAHARIASSIHSLWEVIVGALLGSMITIFVFQVIM